MLCKSSPRDATIMKFVNKTHPQTLKEDYIHQFPTRGGVLFYRGTDDALLVEKTPMTLACDISNERQYEQKMECFVVGKCTCTLTVINQTNHTHIMYHREY